MDEPARQPADRHLLRLPKLLFALAERLFGSLALRDVDQDATKLMDAISRVPHEPHTISEPDLPLVGGDARYSRS